MDNKVSVSSIENPKCEECGKPLVTDQQVKTGCCAECLQVLLDLLPD